MIKTATRTIVSAWLPPRPINAHKGTSGRVLIVAGSRGMVGAAILSAWGAARAGAGLIKLATVKSQQPIAAKRAPLEVTTYALPEDAQGHFSSAALKSIERLINSFRPDVVVFGPGVGVTRANQRIVDRLLRRKGLRLLLDADGLNVLCKISRPTVVAELILTPHAGELARLLNTTTNFVVQNREKMVKLAAARFHGVCLLKGAGTLIADSTQVWKNTTGNPAMASGGMGDVLSGVIAALWASDKKTAIIPAVAGVYLHGLAADLALQDFPERTMLASDLVHFLPKAFKQIRRAL